MKFFNQVSDDAAELWIYDTIGESYWFDAVSANDIRHELAALGSIKELVLRINSEGGSVFDGLAIFNMLRDHPAHITAKVDGVAASIASVICCAADVVQMQTAAWLMIHQPWSAVSGNADELRNTADVLERVGEELITAYQTKAALSRENLKSMMDAETWLNAEEATDYGFCDVTNDVAIAARAARTEWLGEYRRAPELIAAPIPAKRLASQRRMKVERAILS